MYYAKMVWKWKGMPIQLSGLKSEQLVYIKNVLSEKKGFWYRHNYKEWLNAIEMIERDREYKMVTKTIVNMRQQRLTRVNLRANIIAERFLTKLYDLKCSDTQQLA